MEQKTLNEKLKEVKKPTIKLQKQLKEEFEKVINNPTEKQIKGYKEAEQTLIAVWLADVVSSIFSGINESVKNGKSLAIEQLRGKGFKKVLDNQDIYSELSNAQKQMVKADLEKIVSGIMANSRRNIAEMREAFILQKKKLTKDFFGTFKKYGIAYFTDRAGRRWTLERYVKMATQTVLVSVERQAYFAKSVEWGNDLVMVVHLTHEEPCELCQPFQGKVLSITGKTKGYTTVEYAESMGLFHVSCLDTLELAPENPQDDSSIEFNEANEKRRKYNERFM